MISFLSSFKVVFVVCPHGRWASRCVVSSNKCSFDSFFPFLNHRDRVKRHSSMQCEGFSSLTNGQRANDVKWKVRGANFRVVTVRSWRLSRNRRQLSPQTPHAPKPFKFFKFDETAAKRNFDWFTRHPWPRWLHQHLNQRSLLMTIVVVRRREKRILWTLLFLLCVWHPWLNAKHVLFNCPPWLIKLLLKQKCWGICEGHDSPLNSWNLL